MTRAAQVDGRATQIPKRGRAALSRSPKLDVKGPQTAKSGEGWGHSFPFRDSVDAKEMDLECGAFLSGLGRKDYGRLRRSRRSAARFPANGGPSGTWEFSALLLRPLRARCSTCGITWRFAALCEGHLSMSMRLEHSLFKQPGQQSLGSLRRARRARSRPDRSTARHRQCFLPAIGTTSSPRGQISLCNRVL